MAKKLSLMTLLVMFVLLLQACVPGAKAMGTDPLSIPVTGGETIEDVALPMIDEVKAEAMGVPQAMSDEGQDAMSEKDAMAEEIAKEEVRPAPVHSMLPGQTILIDVQTVTDCLSGGSRVEGEPIIVGSGCDVWPNSFIERPFGNTRVDYDPGLDIVKQQLGYDDTFFYARLTTFMDDVIAPEMSNNYGIELDLDVDEDGDMLIYVVNPQQMGSGDWSADGVYIWQDLDDDVGGTMPVHADDQPYMGNGYETLLFKSGYGEDADAAFARLSESNPNAVEFAFKRTLVGQPESFVWWMWAVEGNILPATFDYVDKFTPDEKFNVDNTCRWLFGAPPNAELANSCPVWAPPTTPGPGPDTPPPSQPGSPNQPPPVIIN